NVHADRTPFMEIIYVAHNLKSLHDITEYLDIKFVNGGTGSPFSAKIPQNIDCGEDSILKKHGSLELRACKTGNKVGINKKGSNSGPTTGTPPC
ncbi:29175_t:CDS:1, partial [Racocetra persica]